VAAHITVHGHFYQPPRENPWTGVIDPQPSARPFRDWNERIHAECYKPNAYATLPTEVGDRTVNNFERLSFNIGPTLMAWLETAHPDTYHRILDADRVSAERLGHGNALAQAFHHTILPLSPARDVRTQVRWGLGDFRHRFGRDAAGMWLPETAVNEDVLDIFIEEGVGFTVMAAHQAKGEIDTRRPYRYLHRDGSGRSIALFFFDGDLSHAIGFNNAASSAEGLIDAFEKSGGDGLLVNVATDGETYGHHFRFADLGLAYALFVEAESRGIEVVNYARHLEDFPPTEEIRLAPGEGTSWSCPHGVARWKLDCGCSTGGEPEWNQAWRAPVREALDLIRVGADEIFERLGSEIFDDPWRARDLYVNVVLGAQTLDDFISSEASGPLSPAKIEQAGTLLDMQASAMSMFTSCGWFFNDIAGIETVQILRYAARTLELFETLGQPSPRNAFLTKMKEAVSNDPAHGTGADIFASLS
jgi:alpha-amylase/alpha-mannosidase (GH57 family)